MSALRHSVEHEAYSISADFNLDFYTEVQDLSYLENLLTQQSPRFAALNMAICSLIEDFSLVGFETLAVEVSPSVPPPLGHRRSHSKANSKYPD